MPNSSIRWISTHLRRLWFLLLPLRRPPRQDSPSAPGEMPRRDIQMLQAEMQRLAAPLGPIFLPWRAVVSGLTFYYQVPKIPRWCRARRPQLSPLLLRHSKSRLRWNPPMQAPCRRSSRSRLRHRGRLLPWAVKRRVLAQFRRPFRPKRPARVTGLHRGLRR